MNYKKLEILILQKIVKSMSNCFSVKEFSKTHNQIFFCGLKLRYPKKQYLQAKKNSPFHWYKKNNFDITKLPKAKGRLRDLQLANLAILKQFDEFCLQNNLTYFLFAGSALGQIRHQGFIPWDDDIDVAMPRNDYDALLSQFNKTDNPLLFAEPYISTDNTSSIIKIRSKKSDKFFIDIFAFDITGRNYSPREKVKYTQEIKNIRYKLKQKHDSNIIDKMLELRSKYIDFQAPKSGSDILLGIEWGHSEPNWFLQYNTVYPIKNTIFENLQFKSMANPEQYLKDYYGNYMAYPNKLPKGHSMYDDFSKEDFEAMLELKGLL